MPISNKLQDVPTVDPKKALNLTKNVVGPSGFLIPDAKVKNKYAKIAGTQVNAAAKTILASMKEISIPNFSMKPLNYAGVKTDFTQIAGGLNAKAMAKYATSTPTAFKATSIAAQGGVTGTSGGKSPVDTFTGGKGEPWNYTQDPLKSSYAGGTASGGMWFMPPEVDPADDGDNYAPPGITKSATYLGAVVGAYFASGKPHLAGGGVKSGFRWGDDASNNLVFQSTDAYGAATDVFRGNQTNSVLQFKAGASTGWGTVEGLILNHHAEVFSTGSASEETLLTVTLLANTLNANQKGLRITSYGFVEANANAKSVRLYIGSTEVARNDVTTSPNNLDFRFDVMLYRFSATTHDVIGYCVIGSVQQSATYTFITLSTTVNQTITLRCLATVAANDVAAEGLFVEMLS